MAKLDQVLSVMLAKEFEHIGGRSECAGTYVPFNLVLISHFLGMVSDPDQLGFLCCYVHACCTSSFLLRQHLFDILGCVCVAAGQHDI